jgi:phenylacetate-CoA ligase
MSSILRRRLFEYSLRLYGVEFIKDYAEAVHNQYLEADALAELQAARLDAVINRAASGNDTYRRLVKNKAGVDFETQEAFSLCDFPVVTKDDLVQIASGVKLKHTFLGPVVKRTSGSSGRPLCLFKQRSGLSRELASTWRSYGWYGIAPGDKHVRIWGRPFDLRKRLIGRAKDFMLSSKRISAFDVTRESLVRRLHAIERYQPKFVYGYVSALAELASLALERGQTSWLGLSVVITTAEPLDLRSRNVIESAFGVPCRDEYGCSEVGSIAHECHEGNLHIMADNLVAEVLASSGVISETGYGELLITDLSNLLTPVVRYKVGDYCFLHPGETCSCGIKFPVIAGILGRVEDAVIMPDGTKHHPAKICYLVDKADEKFGIIRKYQVKQVCPTEFVISIVAGDAAKLGVFKAELERVFSNQLQPGLTIDLKVVSDIERDPSGKYRLVCGIGS